MSYGKAREALDKAHEELVKMTPYNWDNRVEKTRLWIELATAEIWLARTGEPIQDAPPLAHLG